MRSSVTGRGQQICDMGGVLLVALEVSVRERREREGHDQDR